LLKLIKDNIYLHQKILKYFVCSAIAAVCEVVLGFLLLKLMPQQIVVANTIAIIISAILHYFITLIFVFRKKNNYQSILIYASTFILGIIMQDYIIWLFYEKIFANMQEQILRYIFSKGLSLSIPFFVLYYIRSVLNERIKLGEAK
jgi:putative flippase GtrA